LGKLIAFSAVARHDGELFANVGSSVSSYYSRETVRRAGLGQEMKFFGPHSSDDLFIATIAGLLAGVITLALKVAFSG
jgi:hypothetical protein